MSDFIDAFHQKYSRVYNASRHRFPSSAAKLSYGNSFGANGTLDGLSTITAAPYTHPRKQNAPIRYAAAPFFVTMRAGTASSAGS